jgi:excisionase family DNA binding protein
MTVVTQDDATVFTVDEVAKMLRISRGAAFAGVANKDIPSVRVGRRILVPAAAFRKMLTGGAKEGEGA